MRHEEPPSSTASRVAPSPPPSAYDGPNVAPRQSVDVHAARAKGFSLRHADDLQAIEGIGPKVDELLRSNGVTTFA